MVLNGIGLYIFMERIMLSMYSNLARQHVSSTNLFHSFTLFLKFGITDVSSSTMNMFASTGPNRKPIATPST